jgi:hypothetical protein
VVRASKLDAREVLSQMEAGRFYASSGVEIDSVRVTGQTMMVAARQHGDFKFTTDFIGQDGKLLQRSRSNPATYTLTGTETYVRARVKDSGGFYAWLQPVFVAH